MVLTNVTAHAVDLTWQRMWCGDKGFLDKVHGKMMMSFLQDALESVEQVFFPTCQVRVVRFYVSLFFSFFSFFSFFFSFSSSSLSSPPSSFSSINWDPLCSVWRAGPQWQLGSSQFSVACWTPNATGILSVQCGVLDPNRDLMSSVWRAGPQPRYCEFSVACWTPTAILRVECGVLDPNRDIACSVWRPGPQPRYCEFSVVAWTPTAIL